MLLLILSLRFLGQATNDGKFKRSSSWLVLMGVEGERTGFEHNELEVSVGHPGGRV